MNPKGNDSKKSKPVGSSQSATAATVNFLDLPDWVRHKIYDLVLNVLHPLHLFQEPGSSVQSFVPDKPLQWLALLHTNRQIYVEASAALYRVNHFELVDITKLQIGVLQSFLDRIGFVNAASLSHLCINFPNVVSIDKEPGKVRLRDNSLQTLKLLQDKCTKLTTLETVVHYKNAGFFTRPDHFLREAFSHIDAQLKAIHSLSRIIVRADTQTGLPTASAVDMMQRLGWEVLSGNKHSC